MLLSHGKVYLKDASSMADRGQAAALAQPGCSFTLHSHITPHQVHDLISLQQPGTGC